jgi:hypothetical protein
MLNKTDVVFHKAPRWHLTKQLYELENITEPMHGNLFQRSVVLISHKSSRIQGALYLCIQMDMTTFGLLFNIIIVLKFHFRFTCKILLPPCWMSVIWFFYCFFLSCIFVVNAHTDVVQ